MTSPPLLVSVLFLLGTPCRHGDVSSSVEPERFGPQRQKLSLHIEAPQVVRRGTPIRIELILVNHGKRPVVASLGRSLADTQPNFFLWIRKRDGVTVWCRAPVKSRSMPSRDSALSQPRIGYASVTFEFRLAPGASYRLKEQWVQRDLDGNPVAVGTYLITGSLRVGRRVLESPGRALRIVK